MARIIDCCNQYQNPIVQVTNFTDNGDGTFSTTLTVLNGDGSPAICDNTFMTLVYDNTGVLTAAFTHVIGNDLSITPPIEDTFGNWSSFQSFFTGIIGDGNTITFDLNGYKCSILDTSTLVAGETCDVTLAYRVKDCITEEISENTDNNQVYTFTYAPPVAKATNIFTGASNNGDFDITWDLKDYYGNPLTPSDLIKLTVKSKVTDTFIGEATFNYGDDISVATPITETDFTTNLQPYFVSGSLTDGGVNTFLKKASAKNYYDNNSGSLAGISKGEEWIITVEAYDESECSWSENLDNTTELQKNYIKESWAIGFTRYGGVFGQARFRANFMESNWVEDNILPQDGTLVTITDGGVIQVMPTEVNAALPGRTFVASLEPETPFKRAEVTPLESDSTNNWWQFEPNMFTDGSAYHNGINFNRITGVSSAGGFLSFFDETTNNIDLSISYLNLAATGFGNITDVGVYIGDTPGSPALTGTYQPFVTINNAGVNIFENFSKNNLQEGIYNARVEMNSANYQVHCNFQFYIGSY